jgi:hypothetical protein
MFILHHKKKLYQTIDFPILLNYAHTIASTSHTEELLFMQERIATRERLTQVDIQDVILGNILVLKIKNYYPADASVTLAEKIINSNKVEQYTHEVSKGSSIEKLYFGVDRLGTPFNSTYGENFDSLAHKLYYQGAQNGIQAMRAFTSPNLGPIDKLRLDLDEICVPGATVASFQGQKMLAGIGRITRSELSHLSAFEPHFDALPTEIQELDAQLAANIYLRVPEVGGELEVWDVPPMTPLAKEPSKWRASLPDPVAVKPAAGDLILFNCRRPHAIRAFAGPDRVTVQMFIGYKRSEPLMLWN